MTKHFQSPFYRSILKVRKTSVRSITTQLSNYYFEYFNIILEIVKHWLNWYLEHFKFIYKGGSWTGETFSGIELFCIIKYHRYGLRFLKKETRSSSFNFRSLKIHSDKSKIYPQIYTLSRHSVEKKTNKTFVSSVSWIENTTFIDTFFVFLEASVHSSAHLEHLLTFYKKKDLKWFCD